jgi:integrase
MPPLCTYRTQPPPQNCRSEAHQPDALKIIQQQVGHSYSSTTALYTSVSADFKQKTIQKMIAQRLRTGGTDEGNGHG